MGVPYVPSPSLSGIKTGHKREQIISDKIKITFLMPINNAAFACSDEMCWCCCCLAILTQSLFHFLIHSKGRSVQLWFPSTMIMVETLQNCTNLKPFSLSCGVAVSQKVLSLELLGWNRQLALNRLSLSRTFTPPPPRHWGDLPLHENCRKAWAECFKAGSVAAHWDTR